jgi:hypothetical protein
LSSIFLDNVTLTSVESNKPNPVLPAIGQKNPRQRGIKFNPEITLGAGFLHPSQGLEFSRAQMTEELIWNSRTQEINEE